MSGIRDIDVATAPQLSDGLFGDTAVFVVESAGDPEDGTTKARESGKEVVLCAQGPITESLCNIQLVGDGGLMKSLGGKAIALQDLYGVPAEKEIMPVGFHEIGPAFIVVEPVPMIRMESGMG